MTTASPLIARLYHKLIVSCQAEDDFPLNTPEHLTAMAQSAVIGGASAIRASEPENIRAMRAALNVPIIGIYKKDYDGFEVRITPTLAEIEAIVEAGSDIIALDATHRPRPDGMSLEDLFAAMKSRYTQPIMADISTLEEGLKAAQLGADIVATTLSGYTDYSPQQTGPNLQLIRDLAAAIDVPIIAEGRIGSPADVRAALMAGAHAVVVGSMITRPHMITQHYLAGTRLEDATSPVIAIDIGGTKIAGGIIGAGAEIINQDKIATSAADGSAVVGQTINLIEQLVLSHHGDAPIAIGISTGGQVSREGRILSATDTITGWAGIDLAGAISTHFGLPTRVLNDGHAAALAEARYGAGQSYNMVLCVTIGTGLGGGLVIDGQLQLGVSGLAGSIGHIKLTSDGPLCSCGQRGCVEAYVSGPALLKAYNARVSSNDTLKSGHAVAERAQAGDKIAIQVVEEMGAWLGLGLANGLATLDADIVVIGGSVAEIGSLLFESIRQSLRAHGFSSTAETPVVPAMFGAKAGLIGAAAFARY